jgi:hypothetical protein
MYRGIRERPNVGVKDSPEAQGDEGGADAGGGPTNQRPTMFDLYGRDDI